MNITQNITYVGPGSSCSYLGARPPPMWQETNSTDAACSVANCIDNSKAIQKCCIGGSVQSFNRTIPNAGGNHTVEGQWLYCALPGVNASSYDDFDPYNPNDPYQAYQDCLVREGTEFLTCNNPSRYPFGGDSSCFGSSGSISTADGLPANDSSHPEQTCTVNTNLQYGLGALLSCCSSSNGTVRAEYNGCQASCSGKRTLQSCLNLNNNNRGQNQPFPSICGNYTSSATMGVGVGNGKLTIVGVLILSTALFAVL